MQETVGEFGDRQRNWLGCALPTYDETIPPPSDGMTCRFVLEDRLDRLGPIHDDVQRVLSSDLVVLALLAQRGVEEFSWNGERWQLSRKEVVVDDSTKRVTPDALDESSGGVVYTKRDGRHVARAPYTAADLVVTACTYPEEMTRAEILASAKTEYKRLQFLKLKHISKDAGIYVVTLYAKMTTAR